MFERENEMVRELGRSRGQSGELRRSSLEELRSSTLGHCRISICSLGLQIWEKDGGFTCWSGQGKPSYLCGYFDVRLGGTRAHFDGKLEPTVRSSRGSPLTDPLLC